jgi:hypothetical protein
MMKILLLLLLSFMMLLSMTAMAISDSADSDYSVITWGAN